MTRRGAVLFAAMCVVWGIPYLLIKVAVRELSPVTLVFGRCLVAVVLLLPVALARRELVVALRRWRPLLAYTVAEIAVPWLFLTVAEQDLSSSLTGLLVAAVPLVGALIAFLGPARARVAPVRLAGLVIGLAGVAALVGFDVHGAQVPALLAVGVVVLGYAIGPAILSHALADLPALGVVTASLTVVTVAYAPFAATRLPGSWPSGRVIAAVVTLGVVCTAAAFLIFVALVAEVGPVAATVFTYVNPAVAVTLGAVFLSEPVTAATIAGFVLILLGSFLATRATRASGATRVTRGRPQLSDP